MLNEWSGEGKAEYLSGRMQSSHLDRFYEIFTEYRDICTYRRTRFHLPLPSIIETSITYMVELQMFLPFIPHETTFQTNIYKFK